MELHLEAIGIPEDDAVAGLIVHFGVDRDSRRLRADDRGFQIRLAPGSEAEVMQAEREIPVGLEEGDVAPPAASAQADDALRRISKDGPEAEDLLILVGCPREVADDENGMSDMRGMEDRIVMAREAGVAGVVPLAWTAGWCPAPICRGWA